MNPVGSAIDDEAASLATAETSVEVAATVSATSEAVDRTASAASEIRREKSLTDNFCAVVRDDVLVVTGAKAEQQLSSADVARMQRRELAIDDDFMISVAVLNESSVSLSAALCSLSALLFQRSNIVSRNIQVEGREGCILVGNLIKWNHVRHYRTSLGHFHWTQCPCFLPFNASFCRSTLMELAWVSCSDFGRQPRK